MSPRIPRMAPRDATHPHPTALQQPISPYGFEGVLRATWREAANLRLPSSRSLVEPDQTDSCVYSQLSQIFICRKASRSFSTTSSPRIEAPSSLTTAIKSTSPGMLFAKRRIASRQRLRTWFRRARLPIAFAATTAARPFPRVQIIRSPGLSRIRPVLKILSKSAFALSRRSLGSKPLSTLFPASLENVLAVLGLHARPEAVRLVLVAVVGLVSALHGLDLG
jgi:hypothetical protein